MIHCNSEYKQLLDKIIKSGNEVNGTYELVGEKVEVMLADTSHIKHIFEISDKFEKEFVEAICTMNDKVIGPYQTEKYLFLLPALKKAVKQLKDDCTETRRCTIVFPSEHCFQSIQFLIRENTVNVVCFMRSCDAVKNLPYDIWLCSKLADMFSYYVEGSPYKCHKITMMFGSLHIYKKDLSHVF